MVTVKVKRLSDLAKLPMKSSDGAAGFDLYATEFAAVGHGVMRVIHTGIAIEIPPGYEGQIRPRSGLAFRDLVTVINSPGTIDSDYRGEILVGLICHAESPRDYVEIKVGDRIAQLVIAPVPEVQLEWAESLSATSRGGSGLGSTGR